MLEYSMVFAIDQQIDLVAGVESGRKCGAVFEAD